MKRFTPLSLAVLLLSFICAAALSAQETTTVSVLVKNDGKVVTDTIYRFEDPEQAEHALKMMEALSGEDAKTIVQEGDHVTVIKHCSGAKHPCHYQGENVVVTRTEDGETYDILIDEDQEGVQTKKVRVMVIEEGDDEWETVEKELGDIDHDTKDDNNGEKQEKEIEVTVIKKKQ